jgi:hypothetical protein
MEAASVRATTSVGPPAANGTTSVTGLEGQADWADAPVAKNADRPATSKQRRRNMEVSGL